MVHSEEKRSALVRLRKGCQCLAAVAKWPVPQSECEVNFKIC